MTTTATDAHLESRLQWFLNNKFTVLAWKDYFLACYSREDIELMTTERLRQSNCDYNFFRSQP